MTAYQHKGTCMDEYMSRVRIWGLTCPGSLEEVGRARRWAREVLGDSPHADDAALIVTELGANALLHTVSGDPAGSFHVSLALSEHVVCVSVTDAGGAKTVPMVEHPDDEDTHGRGLGMVAALAQRVETQGGEDGRTVTAYLFSSTAVDGLACLPL
jgi:anti-sigma regulatory factor (Ser/Thr protein kinase)